MVLLQGISRSATGISKAWAWTSKVLLLQFCRVRLIFNTDFAVQVSHSKPISLQARHVEDQCCSQHAAVGRDAPCRTPRENHRS